MDRSYNLSGLAGPAALGGATAGKAPQEPAVTTIETTLKLAGELAFRVNRLEARLFGERPKTGLDGALGPDGVVNQLVETARSTTDALNDAIRSLNYIAQQMGAE